MNGSCVDQASSAGCWRWWRCRWNHVFFPDHFLLIFVWDGGFITCSTFEPTGRRTLRLPSAASAQKSEWNHLLQGKRPGNGKYHHLQMKLKEQSWNVPDSCKGMVVMAAAMFFLRHGELRLSGSRCWLILFWLCWFHHQTQRSGLLLWVSAWIPTGFSLDNQPFRGIWLAACFSPNICPVPTLGSALLLLRGDGSRLSADHFSCSSSRRRGDERPAQGSKADVKSTMNKWWGGIFIPQSCFTPVDP